MTVVRVKAGAPLAASRSLSAMARVRLDPAVPDRASLDNEIARLRGLDVARAREQGRALGRRRLEDADADKVAAIRRARSGSAGIRRIARDLRVGVGTVLRVTGSA